MTGPRFASAIIVAMTIALTASASSWAIAQTQGTTRAFTKDARLFIEVRALAPNNQDRPRSYGGLNDDRQRSHVDLDDDRPDGLRQRSYCDGMRLPMIADHEPAMEAIAGKSAAEKK